MKYEQNIKLDEDAIVINGNSYDSKDYEVYYKGKKINDVVFLVRSRRIKDGTDY